MALDWSKEVSFSGLRKRKPKAKAEYPSKTYINLVISDKKKFDVRSELPKILLVALLTVLVCKFGVLDFYGKVTEKEIELSQQTQTLQGLEAQLVGYEDVKAEYETYESTKLVADDLTVSAVDALDLIDRFILPKAHIDSMALQGNTITLNLSGITLNGVGKLISKLYEQPIVENVSVSNAATNKTDRVTSTTTTVEGGSDAAANIVVETVEDSKTTMVITLKVAV